MSLFTSSARSQASSLLASSVASAASAAATPRPRPPSPIDLGRMVCSTDWETALVPNLKPPTLEQLNALTAIPAAMVIRSTKGGKSKRQGAQKLAREGQITSKLFDALGARPQPVNGISLEQSIQLEMTADLRNFIVSTTVAGSFQYVGKTFAISDFAGATSLLAVFDQYRFDQIEAWIEFKNPNGVGDFPQLISAVDLDDSNVPTSIGQIQDHQGAISSNGPAGHYHKWKPHIAIAAYSGAFTSYSNAPSSWIDSASPNVQHYGLKAATESSVTAFGVALTFRAVISFRAPAIN